jgi:hypothetical protein
VRAAYLRRAGAGLSLARLLADEDPVVAAVGEIDAGDALASATRFAREWAYRGGQAVLWKGDFAAHEVHDLYLPVSVRRAFDRRGLLRVDGTLGERDLHLFATQFAPDRSSVGELRFARARIRDVAGDALLFVAERSRSRVAFSDLGLRELTTAAGLAVYARGFDLRLVRANEEEGGLDAVVVAEAIRA